METFDSGRRIRKQPSANSDGSPFQSPRARSNYVEVPADREAKEESSSIGGSIRRTFGSIKGSMEGIKDKVMGKSTETHNLRRQQHVSETMPNVREGRKAMLNLSDSSDEDDRHDHRHRNTSKYDTKTNTKFGERLRARNLDSDSDDDDQLMSRKDGRKQTTGLYDSKLTSKSNRNERPSSRDKSSKLSHSNSIQDWKKKTQDDDDNEDSILMPRSRSKKDLSEKSKNASDKSSSLFNRSPSKESIANRDSKKSTYGRRNSKDAKQDNWQTSPSPRRSIKNEKSSQSLFSTKDKGKLNSIDEPFEDESSKKRQIFKASHNSRKSSEKNIEERPKTAKAGVRKPTTSQLSPRKSRPITTSSPRKESRKSINRSGEDIFDLNQMKNSLDMTADINRSQDVGPINHYPFSTPINQPLSQHDILHRTPSTAIRNSTEGPKTGTGQLLGVFEQIKAKRQENILNMSQSGKDLLLKTQGNTGYFPAKSPRDIRNKELANELAQTGQDYFSVYFANMFSHCELITIMDFKFYFIM